MNRKIIALLFIGAVSSANAALSINISESGADVIIVATGSVDTTGLTGPGSGSLFIANINPDAANFTSGAPGDFDSFTGFTSTSGSLGPFNVGWAASSSSGDIVGLSASSVRLPDGYLSSSALTSSATFASQTFAGLGLAPGTYTWTWGAGPNADSATLVIGAVPEPSALALLGVAGGFCLMYRRKQTA